MGQNFVPAIGWKLATVLAVIGAGLAMGGSFYVGKKVGSSKPPTVMTPMPVIADPAQATSQERGAGSSGASPATARSQDG